VIDLVAAQAVSLSHEPVAHEQIVAGQPTTGSAALGAIGEAEYGVWEMTPGAMSDVEEDELFIVIAGSGTVAFDSGETLELAPGTVGRLEAGMRTVWTVISPVRKIWVAGRS